MRIVSVLENHKIIKKSIHSRDCKKYIALGFEVVIAEKMENF